jgi:hypothetical protein
MNSANVASLIPNPDDLLALDVEAQGKLLLKLLTPHGGGTKTTVPTNSMPVNQQNFFSRLGDNMAPPKYGERQLEVDEALLRAWTWLENQGLLVKALSSGQNWFSVSIKGQEFHKQSARFEQWEKLGLNRVKSDLMTSGGTRDVGWPQEVQELAWKWVELKENQAKASALASELTLIAESRLEELRKLAPTQFDFKKLIRLCEELNTAYREECYFATAMLVRGILDHVPPIFGHSSFKEVANNDGGGGKSFREGMQHLENSARKVADAHLHLPIRKSETLPVAQQVNFAAALDVLLSEILRILH